MNVATDVTIDITLLPELEPSNDYNGWVDRQNGISILTQTLAAPIKEVLAGFSPAAFEKQGMLWLEQEHTRWQAGEGLLVHALQMVGDVRFIKWIGAFGNDQRTFVVTGTAPEAMAGEYSEPLRQSILSVRLKSEANYAPQKRFEFRSQGNWQPTALSDLGIAYSLPGQDPTEKQSNPLAIAKRVVEQIPVAEQEHHSQSRIRSFPEVSEVTLEAIRKVSLDDLQGWEIQAVARSGGGEAAVLYQLTLYAESEWYIFQGFCLASVASSILPQLTSLASSFARCSQPA